MRILDFWKPKKVSTWEDTPFNNFVVLPNKESADIFFESVYPHFSSCIVVTADKSFPEDKSIQSNALKKLEENDNVKVVILGAYASKKLKIKSKRKLILDGLLFDQLRAFKFNGLEITPPFLGSLIGAFFTQDRFEMSEGSIYDSKRNALKIKKHNKWIHQILSGKK